MKNCMFSSTSLRSFALINFLLIFFMYSFGQSKPSLDEEVDDLLSDEIIDMIDSDIVDEELLELDLLEEIIEGDEVIEENKTKETKFEEEHEVFEIVESMPQFPGGDLELLKYFMNAIKYPEVAKENKIQGVVVLAFIVRSDGSITDIEISRDIGGGCGEEALRVAKTMPRWKPGIQKGVAVDVEYKFPVRFKYE